MDPRTLSTLKNVLFDTENGNTGIPHLTRKIKTKSQTNQTNQTNHKNKSYKSFWFGKTSKS